MFNLYPCSAKSAIQQHRLWKFAVRIQFVCNQRKVRTHFIPSHKNNNFFILAQHKTLYFSAVGILASLR